MLTDKQLSSIIINAIVVKVIITFPRDMFTYCGNAAWIAGIYTTAVAFCLFYVLKKLCTTQKNVISMADDVGGTPLRIITGLAVFAVLSINFVDIIRVFPEIIRLVLLQKTYAEIIGTVFIITLVLGAWCGIESIARVHQIFLPIAGIVFVGFLICLIEDIDGVNLLPILGNGIKAVFLDGLSGLSVFSDLLLLNILIPYMKDVEDYKKSGTRSILIGGGCMVLVFIAYGLCYAYPVSSEFIIPIYQLERLINLSDFFSRLEALFQFIWAISILLYGTLYLAVLAQVWRESFKLHHAKPLVPPIVILATGIFIIPTSLNDALYYEGIINRWLYIPAFAIPIIIGIIYKLFHVKHYKGDNNEKQIL